MVHVLARGTDGRFPWDPPLQAVARDKSDSFLVISSVSREEGHPLRLEWCVEGPSPWEPGSSLYLLCTCSGMYLAHYSSFFWPHTWLRAWLQTCKLSYVPTLAPAKIPQSGTPFPSFFIWLNMTHPSMSPPAGSFPCLSGIKRESFFCAPISLWTYIY